MRLGVAPSTTSRSRLRPTRSAWPLIAWSRPNGSDAAWPNSRKSSMKVASLRSSSLAVRAFLRFLQTAARAAASDAVLLLRGESGTGKNVLARWIRANSPRAEAPFVTVNCPALSGDLMTSALFGHRKGRIHRRDRRCGRESPGSRGRDAPARRSGRPDRRRAGATAPVSQRSHVRTPGRSARAAGRRTADRRDEPGPRS